MKANKFFIISFCFFVFGINLADDGKNYSEIPSLPDLINLEKKIVEKYKAYVFRVSWIDGRPSIIDIGEEVHDLKNRDVKSNVIALVNPKSNSVITEGADVFKRTLASFSSSSILKVSRSMPKNKKYEDNGEILVRYDGFDSKGTLLHSEWRNTVNGTEVEEIVYSEDGKPMILNFYYKLRTNEDFKSLERQDRFPTLTLDQVVKQFGTFDYSDPDQVVDVCVKLLHYAKKIHGDNLDEEE
jgi:hypothetical protein